MGVGKALRKLKRYVPVPIWGLVVLVVFAGLGWAFTTIAPNTDVSGYIAKVRVGNKWYSASGNTWSKKFPYPDRTPHISVTLTWLETESVGEDMLTFGGDKYRLYKWRIRFSLRVQAVSEEPWHTGFGGYWTSDGGVDVEVRVAVTARTEWRYMWAIVDNIVEKADFNQEPAMSMTTTVRYGDAKAQEPNAANAYVSGTAYARSWDEYWEQFDLSQQPAELRFACYLQPPWWVKDNWLSDDEKGTGYAYVQWDFSVYIAYTARIDPNTGDVEEPLKDPERRYPETLLGADWAVIIVVVVVLMVVAVIVSSVAKMYIASKQG